MLLNGEGLDASAGYCPSAPNNHHDGCLYKSVTHVFMVISSVPNKRMVKVATFNKFAGEKLGTPERRLTG